MLVYVFAQIEFHLQGGVLLWFDIVSYAYIIAFLECKVYQLEFKNWQPVVAYAFFGGN